MLNITNTEVIVGFKPWKSVSVEIKLIPEAFVFLTKFQGEDDQIRQRISCKKEESPLFESQIGLKYLLDKKLINREKGCVDIYYDLTVTMNLLLLSLNSPSTKEN